MKKILSILGSLLVTCAAHAADGDVRKELAHIPAAVGQNVLARMQTCHMSITKKSWVERVPVDAPDSSMKAGDVMIWAVIAVPHPQGADAAQQQALKNTNAGWIRRGNSYLPQTGWAKSLQTEPYPFWWLKC